MFIRKSSRKYKGKSYTNYILVESIRTEKGPRQKTICSLGDLSPRSGSEWLKFAHKIELALIGQDDLLESEDSEVQSIVNKVKARQAKQEQRDAAVKSFENQQPKEESELVNVLVDKVECEEVREAGPVFVGHQFWLRLGLEQILAECGIDKRSRLVSCAMVMNRLIFPKSEHAMPDWFQKTALGDLLPIDFSKLSDTSLYRNLDTLHPKRAEIESKLVERERELFNMDKTILLYDLTSTYFEGQANANPKAKRGYSRDKRPDCKQVVIGLVVNRDGFPVAHEIMEGNTQDRTTLGDMLDRLDERVGLEEWQTIVVDRGMAFDSNIEELKQRKLHYIVASRQPERVQWLAEFESAEGFERVVRIPSPRNPHQKKTEVRVKMVEHEDERHILCFSSGRVEKDRAIRVKHENRLLADIEKLKKRIANGRLVKADKVGEAIGRLKERYPRVARYYKMSYDENAKTFSCERDEEKHKKAGQLDGSYLLKTDRKDLSADEAWRIYSTLTRAEDAFRKMKTPLAERPIFHHLEHRVETHIFLCVLALHLLVSIEKTMLDQNIHTSWSTLRDELSSHQMMTIILPTTNGSTLRIRKAAKPEPRHKEIYHQLHITDDIITAKKTWTQCSDQKPSRV